MSSPTEHEEQTRYPREDLWERGTELRFEYSRPLIDAHTHFYAPAFVDLVVSEASQHGAQILGPDEDGRYTLRALGGGHGAGYFPYNGSKFTRPLTDLDWQLEQMADRNMDVHSLCMTHPKVYWAPPEYALRLSQAQNDGLSELHLRHPDRVYGQIMVPLQDVHLAIEELERASQLPGLRGVNIAHHVNGLNISDRSFWPFLERCQELGQTVFLHNIDPLAPDRLYQGGLDMLNLLGNPFEATVAAMGMILSGALDEFPDLDVFLPHAGGALPWLVWRGDYAQAAGNLKPPARRKASEYLRRFHYDLIMHSPEMMRLLIDIVGADRVVSGTDWPQRMAVWRPAEYVESIPGITRQEAELILCDNPARLMGLDPD